MRKLTPSQRFPLFSKDNLDSCAKGYAPIIQSVLDEVFERLPLSDCKEQFVQLGTQLLCKKYVCPDYTGVVIAGFGERDLFPSLLAFECDGIVDKRLRFVDTKKVQIGPSYSDLPSAQIIPFAQCEMVYRFMDGIDPHYRSALLDYVSDTLLKGYADHVTDVLSGKVPEETLKALSPDLTNCRDKLMTDFRETLNGYEVEKYSAPVIGSVATLPRGDLAAMAEALVNLTAFKRRVSADETETVSPPIDVAVISKGEGFIWIKKKQYFQPGLNPDFLSQYYRREGGYTDAGQQNQNEQAERAARTNTA